MHGRLPHAVPGISTGSRGREAIAFCCRGGPPPETRLRSSRNQSTEASSAGPASFLGSTSPIFTFATGPGVVPSGSPFASARVPWLRSPCGAQHRLEDLHGDASRGIVKAPAPGPHQDDRTVDPVPGPRHACQQRNRGINQTVHSRRPFVVRHRQRPFPVHAPGKVQEEIPRTAGDRRTVPAPGRGGERLARETRLAMPRALIFKAMGSNIGAAAGEDHGGPGPRKAAGRMNSMGTSP